MIPHDWKLSYGLRQLATLFGDRPMVDLVIGAKACRPNPALLPLEFLIGNWATIGTHPAAPGVELPGRTSFAWTENGAFLIMHSETDHKDFPDGMAIFASDNALGVITMCWFDERGISRLCGVRASERAVQWHHDDPNFMQRLTITADPNGQRMTSKGKMAQNGGDWGDDLSQVFIRQ
ncbi:hypothetical protein KRR38_33160 [Novosphingobium sp. G106]|uniref:hypothetical protein n=1 Tax=Novosphingobium sp. G106 TaxID=2849500 RepID=UPI001C2D5208|nr:hypothetical protein [Novosphingobium sp. G106]MBV1692370.1 hypothetical protein [Novosphingobium sp. G106]